MNTPIVRALLAGVEGGCFALILLLLSPLILAKRISSRCIPRDERQSWWRVTTARWKLFLIQGLRPVREQWWDELRHEKRRVAWRYVLLLEVAELLPAKPREEPVESVQMHRALIVKLSHIGDILHMLPMAEAFIQATPECETDLLAGPWSGWVNQRTQLFSNCVFLTPAMIRFNRHRSGLVIGICREIRTLWRLRRRNYDLVITTAALSLSELAYVHWIRPGRWLLSGAYPGCYPPPGDILETPVNRTQYEAERTMGMLGALDMDGAEVRLRFPVLDEERQQVTVELADRQVLPGTEVIAIAPGSGWDGKNWPSERFSELAEELASDESRWIVVLGTAEDGPAASEITRRVGARVLNLVGRTSIGEAAAWLERADLLVGNDSGLLHVAAALDTPTVSLFGPTTVSQWAPRGDSHRSIQVRQDCEGCIYWHPHAGCQHDHRCMNAIPVDDVVSAVRELLQPPHGT